MEKFVLDIDTHGKPSFKVLDMDIIHRTICTLVECCLVNIHTRIRFYPQDKFAHTGFL